jgi:hypothetical protein
MSLTLKERIKLFTRHTGNKTPIAPERLTIQDWGNKSLCFKDKIPPIVWIYWHSEIIESPVTQFCVKRIKELNPLLTVHVLHQNNFKEWLPEFPEIKANLPMANISDLIRLMLLKKYGGFYLDASIILNEPLEWLYKLQEKNSSEFVGYYLGASTRNDQFPTIETWCIGATRDSNFISDWLKEYEKCILSDDPDCYYDSNRELSWEESAMGWKYFKCFFACQLVTRRSQNYHLTLIRADDDAYLYCEGITDKWNSYNLAQILMVNKEPKFQPKMIKLTKEARNSVDEFLKKGYYKKDSYLLKIM